MKALKKESETIQNIVRETMALLKQARDKLEEVYDKEGVMQIHNLDAGQCVIHAGWAIEAAAAWLSSEHGEDQDCCLQLTPKNYGDPSNFDF